MEQRARVALRGRNLVARVSASVRGSLLGKIEIPGPGARLCLDHFYINRLDSLKPGRVRYGIMLRENGVIFYDGATPRTRSSPSVDHNDIEKSV